MTDKQIPARGRRVAGWRRRGSPGAAAAHAPAASIDPQTVVLVEGVSDQIALEAIAARRGRDLAAEAIAVVPMGGASNIRRFLERFGPRGRGPQIGGPL